MRIPWAFVITSSTHLTNYFLLVDKFIKVCMSSTTNPPYTHTGITVGLVNTHYVYLPIPVIIQAPRKVDPRGKMWNRWVWGGVEGVRVGVGGGGRQCTLGDELTSGAGGVGMDGEESVLSVCQRTPCP